MEPASRARDHRASGLGPRVLEGSQRDQFDSRAIGHGHKFGKTTGDWTTYGRYWCAILRAGMVSAFRGFVTPAGLLGAWARAIDAGDVHGCWVGFAPRRLGLRRVRSG
jgi:hypothetical protein